MPREQESLVTGSLRNHVFRLSGVMIVGFLAMTIGQLVEVFYIGMVGLDALAALAFSFPVAMALGAFIRGIGIGASTMVARAAGEGHSDGAAVTTTHCFVLIVILTLLLALTLGPFLNRLYALLGARDQVLLLVVEYTTLWLVGYPLSALAVVSNGIIRSTGNARFAGYIMVSAPIVQVIAGPVFIFGWLGVPALGLVGAAVAYITGSLFQTVIAGYWYFFHARMFRPRFAAILTSWYNILHVGIPAAATNLIQPVTTGITTWLLAGYGVTVVAGFGVASRIESVAAMVTIGIATSVVPIVGQNWGAHRFERVHAALRICYLAGHVWGLVAAVILWAGAGVFVALINDDPALLEPALAFLYIVPISLGFMGMINVSTNAFNAIRKPLPALVISILRLVAIYVPLAFTLGEFYGYQGIFVATALANVMVGFGSVYWNRRQISQEQRRILSTT